MRLFPHRSGDQLFFFSYPECNTGLFSVDFPVIATTNMDSRQSTINSAGDASGISTDSRTVKRKVLQARQDPRKPLPLALALSVRVPQLSTHLSWPRPRSGFSFSKCTLLFLYVLLRCFKEKILCNYRSKCSELYSRCNKELFLYKIKLYGFCVNYFVSETPVPSKYKRIKVFLYFCEWTFCNKLTNLYNFLLRQFLYLCSCIHTSLRQ